jgi:DNA-binding winged helix-turn-helix (wHTH) protein/TolB-like protein
LLFLFDNFILDVDHRELRRDGAAVPMQPQVFDLLEYLIRNRHQVVTKHDLIDTIWGGRIVSESTLATRINAVRKAIGDSGDAQRLIRTLPRKGLRFVGTVREADKPAEDRAMPATAVAFATPLPALVDDVPPPSTPGQSILALVADGEVPARAGRWRVLNMRTLVTTLALAFFVSAFVAQRYLHSKESQSAPQILVPIGVLAFEPLDTSDQARSVAALLSDDLVNVLSRVSNLQVVSRLTSRQNGARSKDVAAIGRELGVRYLLDGTVRIEADALHLNIELIDINTGLQVWSNQFERSPADSVLTRQDIVRGIGRSLDIEVISLNRELIASSSAQSHKKEELKDGELLTLGWSALYGTAAANTYSQAEASFRELLRRDPEQLSAMLGLAAHHIIAVGNLIVPEREPYLTEADDLLNRVLIRQPSLGPAYYYRGLSQKLRGELQPALTSFERSAALNPSFAPAYGQIGQVLVSLGRVDEGLEQVRYAMRLSPQDPSMPSWDIFAGQGELERGQDAKALDWLLRAVALSPDSRLANGTLAAAYALASDHANTQLYAAKFKTLTKGVSDRRRLELFGAFLPPSSPHRTADGLRTALGDSTDERRPVQH